MSIVERNGSDLSNFREAGLARWTSFNMHETRWECMEHLW